MQKLVHDINCNSKCWSTTFFSSRAIVPIEIVVHITKYACMKSRIFKKDYVAELRRKYIKAISFWVEFPFLVLPFNTF